MKRLLILITLQAITAQASPQFIIHDKNIQTETAAVIDSHIDNACTIDVAYVPQQLITIHNRPKRLSANALPFENQKRYFKYITQQKTPTSIELLVSNEPVSAYIKQVFAKSDAPLAPKKVIRLYRRVGGADSSQAQWKPLLSIAGDQQEAMAHIAITPQGTIELQKA